MKGRLKLPVLLLVTAYLAGCVVLVPFVEPDQSTKQEIQSAKLATPSGRREYRSRKYPVRSTAEQKVERLVRQLKSPVTLDRIYAAYDLGALGPQAAEAVPALVVGLRDETKFVRRAAVKALAKIGSPACTALPDMRRSMSDKDNFVSRSSGNAVKKLQPSCQPGKASAGGKNKKS